MNNSNDSTNATNNSNNSNNSNNQNEQQTQRTISREELRRLNAEKMKQKREAKKNQGN